MKTLEHHKLIYDEDCPMCCVYSAAFIQSKMLDENGRENYRNVCQNTKNLLDLERAKNEIALVNLKENKVHYGLDSLLIIIGNSFPFLEKIGRISFIHYFFCKLYSLVSYNRKQIIPSENDFLENACVPSFNLKYRFIYLFSGLLFVAYFYGFTLERLGIHQNYFENFAIIFGCFLWQFLFFKNKTLRKFADYAGNLMTILIAATLVIIPFVFFNFSHIILKILIFSIVIFINVDHYRRCKILKKNNLTNISFLFYQIILYFLILSITTKI